MRRRQIDPKRRLSFAAVSFAVSLGVALLPLVNASCRSAQSTPDDPKEIERLRELTHGFAVLPPENVFSEIETRNANTRVAALARLVRARIKLAANDFNGAASLLDGRAFQHLTSVADYALLLRADALAKANRRPEARAAYEQLARDFPASPRARDAVLRGAQIALESNEAAAVPALVKKLADANDFEALLLTAKAYEKIGDGARAGTFYRRITFYAPVPPTSLVLSSPTTAAPVLRSAIDLASPPPTTEELITRANKLYEAKRYADAADAYASAFGKSPTTADAQSRLRHGVAAFNAKRYGDAVSSLNAVPTGAGEARAEALLYAAQSQARLRQWDAARATIGEMRRAFPDDARARRAITAVGVIAKELKDDAQAQSFFHAAVAAYPGTPEVAQAQFELAWAAHDAKNFAESSRLLLEHLALYADRNTDNRGRAGYWAARDAERAGKLNDARTLYRAMLQRYDANWYGYLAKQRLDALKRADTPASTDAENGNDSQLARAVQNLSTVTVAEETSGAESDEALRRADELNVVGLDDWAVDEVERVLQSAPASPRLTLAKARILRTRGQNLLALVAMQKPYPDYAQMKPEELSREEWDAFYPLSYWDTITSEARARGLDPYRVAAFIRQETVFEPRAASHANAYGLMQLIMDTAQRTARRVGVNPPNSVEELFNPQLNIKLGTAYLRAQLDAYGRVEYAAAAYNAGPGRLVRWRAELPAEIDEWAEAVPFRETRQYIQGIIRNTLQYQRLYDERGRFRAEVGARPVRPAPTNANAPGASGNTVRPRRIKPGEDEYTEN
ncbi:MAG: transglycosylase SLT domain-containing protein [Acidobacteria bacterium]|nr:transglycosylase SLT domain-containing protein [Acidobacteriota bacterium]